MYKSLSVALFCTGMMFLTQFLGFVRCPSQQRAPWFVQQRSSRISARKGDVKTTLGWIGFLKRGFSGGIWSNLHWEFFSLSLGRVMGEGSVLRVVSMVPFREVLRSCPQETSWCCSVLGLTSSPWSAWQCACRKTSTGWKSFQMRWSECTDTSEPAKPAARSYKIPIY